MYINEITNESVTLHVSKEDATLDLIGLVYTPDNEADEKYIEAFKSKYPTLPFIVLHPIHEEEKLLNFECDAQTDVIADSGSLPLMWQAVTIINVYLPEKGATHFVLSKNEGKKTNRRNGFRINLRLTGKMLYKEKEIPDIGICDLSVSGIGLEVPSGEYDVGEQISIVFKDKDIRFNLNAVIVRQGEKGRFTIIGCKFLRISELIAGYINMKQQQKAKGK